MTLASIYGDNVLADSLRDENKRRMMLETWIERQPRLLVIMSDPAYANYLANHPSLGSTIVVHRYYRPDDHEFHRTWKGREYEWLQEHSANLDPKVWIQVLNEPDGWNSTQAVVEQVQFVLNVSAAAAHLGRKIVAFNYSKGNPNPTFIERGLFDAALTRLTVNGHALGLHFYFEEDAEKEAYTFRNLLSLWAGRLSIKQRRRLLLLVTEFGRDIGGGENDGWRATGWTEQEYAQRCIRAANHMARVWGQPVPVAVYCRGAGYGNKWRNFDTLDARDFHKILTEQGKVMFGMPKSYIRSGPAKVAALPARYIRLRSAPSTEGTTILGQVSVGHPVQVLETWARIRSCDGTEGWISLQGGKVELEFPEA